MVDLNEIRIFIKVAQAGSFTRAARELGMPNSTVSAKVSSLERRLGVTLIQRTTRRLNVTSAGQSYLEAGLQGLEKIETAETELAAARGEPRGQLRITAPVELGASLLPPVLAEYAKKFAQVRVDVRLSDERTDMLEENMDLALRVGELKDSTLIAKRLGSVTFALFASPRYLKAAARMREPRDLINQSCIQFQHFGAETWKLTDGKTNRTVALPGRILLNDLNMVKTMTIDGHGVALLPSFFCHAELTTGKLERVLPNWRTGYSPVHFIYPAQRFVPPRLSAFIELATPALKRRLEQTHF